jgi:hypothetical protein
VTPRLAEARYFQSLEFTDGSSNNIIGKNAEEALPDLRKTLKDRNGSVRIAAQQAIERIEGKRRSREEGPEERDHGEKPVTPNAKGSSATRSSNLATTC